MKKKSGLLMLVLALLLAQGCASVNGKQAAVEGGAGAVIGAVLGFAVGTTIGHPNDGARIGAAIGATTGATHGLFNRDEEILAAEQRTQDALALSNQALAQAIKNQRAGRSAGNKAVADKNPSTKLAGGAPSCNCPETEVYNATKFEIVVKLGSDSAGTFVSPHMPMCFGPGKVFAAKVKKTILPGDWVVKDPSEHKKVIFTDADFKKK
jgi:hypothetical protein